MARETILTKATGKVKEVDLVFEQVDSTPRKVSGEWEQVPVAEETYALYIDSGSYPKKMYFGREAGETLLQMIAKEFELQLVAK